MYRLIEVASDILEPAASALMVGHNPGFEELFATLTGDDRHLPTAALACIELSIQTWSRIKGQRGELKWLVTPKELKHD
jgi:phosphohistidine phosphatase